MRKLQRLNEKGLTLIEILAVIVILAIIAEIAIPSMQGVINNQRDKAILSDIVHMLESSKMQVIDNECQDDNICEYNRNPANNEINFNTSKFDEGTVNFTLGNSTDKVMIWVELDPATFKGRNRDEYIRLLNLGGTKIFPEQNLLDAISI